MVDAVASHGDIAAVVHYCFDVGTAKEEAGEQSVEAVDPHEIADYDEKAEDRPADYGEKEAVHPDCDEIDAVDHHEDEIAVAYVEIVDAVAVVVEEASLEILA